jgi:cellulose synthase/poly-beta-1,6-N-acetylglucosamine synthase-like glycosyltransferase
MSVSLIIPCKNGEDTLKMCLDSIAQLDYPFGFDVILVDDGSTDATNDLMLDFKIKYPQIKTTILHGEGILGAGNAINIGWLYSESDIIAVTNADCVLDKDWLTELLKPFEDPLVGGVSGNVLTPPGLNLLQRLIGYELEYRYSKYPEYILSPQDSGLAYRRKVLEKVGGYDICFKTGYDVDIGYRVNNVGFKIKYQPSAKVYHYHRASILLYWRQQAQTSRARKQILFKHPRGIKGDNLANQTLMLLPPLVIILLIGLLVTIMNSVFALLLAFVSSIYIILILEYVLKIYYSNKKIESFFLIPLMIYRSIALAWGVLS